jgi:hypothetical protein
LSLLTTGVKYVGGNLCPDAVYTGGKFTTSHIDAGGKITAGVIATNVDLGK